MTIAYNLGIPAANDDPSVDQPNMLTNNDNIATYVAIDHVGFNTSGSGFHNKTTYVQQVADPGSAAAQYVEYAKAVSGSSELFAQKDAVGAAIQLTRGVPTIATKGKSYLPGGLLIQWDNIAIAGSSQAFTFVTPFTTVLYSLVLGGQQNTTFWVSGAGLSGGTMNRSGSGASGCYYVAIGV